VSAASSPSYRSRQNPDSGEGIENSARIEQFHAVASSAKKALAALISILHLEDSDTDAKLISRELRKGGLTCAITLVSDEDAYRSAIQQGGFDIILSDYRLGLYDGDRALKLAREKLPHVPFIMVTGELGEDRAIETMKSGATDYVLKDRLKRLVPAVTRALHESENHAQRQRAEYELRRNREQLLDFIENACVGMHWVGPDGKILWANQTELDMLGYTRGEYVGHRVADFHVDPAIANDILAQLLRGESVHERGAQMRHKDGSVRHVLINSNGLWENGKFVHSRGFTRDVTDRKHAEQTLSERLEEIETIMNVLPVGLFIAHDRDASRITGNRASKEFLKMPTELANMSKSAPDTGAPTHFRVFKNGRELQAYEFPVQRAAADGIEVHNEELDMVFDDGQIRHALISALPLLDRDGQPRGAVASFVDITERKRAEAQRAHLASFPELNSNPIMEIDLNGRIQYANPATRKTFPDLDQQGLNHPWFAGLGAITESFRQGTISLFSREVTVTGRTYHQDFVYLREHSVIRIYSSDITSRRQAEDDALRSREALERKHRKLQVIHHLTESVSRAVTLQEIYEEAIAGLREAVNADRASILVFDDQNVMRFKAWSGLSDAYRAAVDGHSPWSTDTRDPDPIVVPDAANDPSISDHLKEVLRGEGIRALAFVPLKSNGLLLGKFMVYYNTVHPFSDEEIQTFETLARHVAFAIERKRSEEALADEVYHLQLSAEAANQRAFEHIVGTGELRWSPMSKPMELFDGAMPNPTVEQWQAMIVPEDRHVLDRAIEHVVSHATDCDVEYRVRTHDGRIRWVAAHGRGMRDATGQLVRIHGLVTDITERKHIEEMLMKSEERFRNLLHLLPVAVYTTDSDGRITFFNEAAAMLWGRRPEIGKDVWCGSWRIFDLDGTAVPVAQYPLAIALREGHAALGREIIVERPDGVRRTVKSNPQLLRNAMGELVGAINMLIDVTEEKRLVEIQAHLAAIVRSSDDAIVSKTLEGIVTSWNLGAERLFGYAAAEMIGKSITTIIPPDRLDEETMILDRLRRGEHLEHYDTVRITKDGRPIAVSLTISPVKDASGKIIGASKIARDITERKQLEDQLRQSAEQLEARVRQRTEELTHANEELDAFVHSISHDLRAPLRAIASFSNILLEDHQQGLSDEGKRRVQMIAESAERMNRLTAGLLEFSRLGRHGLRKREVNMCEVARSIVHRLQEANPKRAVDVSLEEISPIMADPLLVKQVLENIIGNAFKYTLKQPHPRIEIGNLSSNGDVVYFVRDNGAGFNQTEAGKLFKVFQRLHADPAFEGSGVGLAIVERIIRRHGGRVWAEGEIDKGATFYFSLPVLGEMAETPDT
jgi:PAS domain S-box-containing protein